MFDAVEWLVILGVKKKKKKRRVKEKKKRKPRDCAWRSARARIASKHVGETQVSDFDFGFDFDFDYVFDYDYNFAVMADGRISNRCFSASWAEGPATFMGHGRMTRGL